VEVRQGLSYRLLNLRPVVYLGTLSYSVYIWQQIFLEHDGRFSAVHPWFMRFPFCVLLAFLTAAASYHLLEMPLMKLREKYRA
jgi:peptidoglycan/LPS O-acetylase OafA/YrhL